MIALARPADPAPMPEINVTPLIDVMLVLIIMLIITIPMQTHAVKLDLPSTKTDVIDRNRNLVTIAANGQLNWNGNAVSDREMSDLLAATAQLPVTPELHVRPDAKAPYAAVDKLLVMTKRAEVRHLGFVGNEAYARF